MQRLRVTDPRPGLGFTADLHGLGVRAWTPARPASQAADYLLKELTGGCAERLPVLVYRWIYDDQAHADEPDANDETSGREPGDPRRLRPCMPPQTGDVRIVLAVVATLHRP